MDRPLKPGLAGLGWCMCLHGEGSMWRRGAMVSPAPFCHCVMALCSGPVQQRSARSQGRSYACSAFRLVSAQLGFRQSPYELRCCACTPVVSTAAVGFRLSVALHPQKVHLCELWLLLMLGACCVAWAWCALPRPCMHTPAVRAQWLGGSCRPLAAR
jgi:hypothetical protein